MRRLLREQGYSLQANAKTIEGTQHPDRDAQFRYLNDQVREHHSGRGQPVISVDTKKKELVGQYKNGGREWRPTGEPEPVKVHDFPIDQLGKAIPYGVYDLAANTGWCQRRHRPRHRRVRRGHDPPLVAGGRRRPLPARRQAADHRRRRRLQRLPHPALEDRTGRAGRRDRAGDHGLPLPARHLQVEQDRAPAVLPHLDELARPTADQPRGHRQPDRRDHHPHRADRARRTRPPDTYPTGIKITDKQMRELEARAITRHDWHGEWNYTLRPDQPTPSPARGPVQGDPEMDRAWLTRPAVTGLQPAAFEELAYPDRRTTRHATRSHPATAPGEGNARPPETAGPARAHSPSPSRIATTLIKDRFELPTKDIAALLDIAASSVVRIIAETQPLLTQLDHRTQSAAAITTATQFNAYLAANGVVP